MSLAFRPLAVLLYLSAIPAAALAGGDCSQQPDHTQTVQCLKKEGTTLNRELKQAYEELLGKLKQAEQTLPQRYRGKLVSKFKASHKAWEKYRETQCEFERMHALGGIDEPVISQQCRNNVNKARLQALKDQIGEWSY